MKQAVAAMSGGVDSSVAAFLVKEAGYKTAGATMRLFDNEITGISGEKTSCSLSGIGDARSVAEKLGIRFIVYDMRSEFRTEVIDRFVEAYERGETPNPCIDCNRHLKFDSLYRLAARDLGNDDVMVATGHYAIIEKDAGSGRFMLRKAACADKDQSYVLYNLTQDQLARTLFPLGGMTKQQVRKIAEEQGLVTAHKRESQDICFVPDGKYADFISGYTGRSYPPGDFTDADGNILGQHKGIIRYTIGQRKGLGLALKKPVYVRKLDMKGNRVIIGDNDSLFSRELTAGGFNWLSTPVPRGEIRALVKIRYKHEGAPATVIPVSGNEVRVIFDEPQRAITPGQSAVLYDGDYVLGGGVIKY